MKKYDSTALIGNSEEEFDRMVMNRRHPYLGEGNDWDWVSFYNGWIAGRIAMLGENKEGTDGSKEEKAG